MGKAFYYAVRHAGRTAVREYNRSTLARERAIKKQEKLNYIETRMRTVNNLNNEIKDKISKYLDNSDKLYCINWDFDFDKFKRKYTESKFLFRDAPKYIDKASQIIIPSESWLEKIFKKRKQKRLFYENQKEKQKENDKLQHIEAMEQYKKDFKLAKDKHYKNENKIKNEIILHNKSIDEWKEKYFFGEKEAVEKFFETIVTTISSTIESKFIDDFEIKYIAKDNHILLNLYAIDFSQLFNCIGYKYIQSKDEIREVFISKQYLNELLFFIIPRIAIIYLNILFKSNLASSIDSAVVNVKYMNNYCVSISITKDQFNNFSLNDSDQFNKMLESYMKICKTFSKGIKPFEE